MSFRLLQLAQTNIASVAKGAALRNYHLACQLAKTMRVTHLGFQDTYDALSGASSSCEIPITLVPRLQPYSLGKLMLGVVRKTPAGLLNFASTAMVKALETELAQDPYDIIQIEGIEMFGYLHAIRSSEHRPKYIVMDWHNIESELMHRYSLKAQTPLHRLYLLRVASQFKKIESEILKNCDLNLVVSERERQNLLRRQPQSRVMVLENGVNVEKFDSLFGERDDRKMWANRHRVLFVGSMDYHPNIDAVRYFADEIWPSLQRRLPSAVFTVVGRNPHERVRALAHRAGIEVTGTVPDVHPFYSQAFVAVVPLRMGGGTRLKILEAMAAGLPVVSTSLGAEGLAVQPNVQLELADSPREFCSHIIALRNDYPRWRDLSVAGRKLAETRYNWNAIGAKLNATYKEMLHSVSIDTPLVSVAG
jgi:glycosyltransferase involved in cell wall biosynthesis